ncbi:hypothetical protein Tco_0496988 [Tanacetum coccineum]
MSPISRLMTLITQRISTICALHLQSCPTVVAVSDVPGSGTRVHTPAHGGSEGTDIINSTRKRPKPDKHGHENKKECTRAEDLIAEHQGSSWQKETSLEALIGQKQDKEDTRIYERNTQGQGYEWESNDWKLMKGRDQMDEEQARLLEASLQGYK